MGLPQFGFSRPLWCQFSASLQAVCNLADGVVLLLIRDVRLDPFQLPVSKLTGLSRIAIAAT